MSQSRPHLVGHVHLKVRDVERAIAFYADVLGLETEERYDRFAFLSWGERHHDVALQGVGADAPGPGPGVGMYHAAFEVETAEALKAVYRRVRERDAEVAPVDHGISKAIYFDDPDGNGLEVYLDTRGDGGGEWEGRNRRFDPEAL
ncbi:biphenyl-2,3-diol 1,2-dioxygenase [Halostella sp. JP-L12]|uniref:VOC family protein n=1 Tax=Halostella TaxID=1843185 RepID=UPI000EF7DF74|nr:MULTISPECIES: VOC family protein [Halostella]NHN47750.1 biphenyl-2,3-diol 1,2-dioxygenase [Halostella sp. JP-L12]